MLVGALVSPRQPREPKMVGCGEHGAETDLEGMVAARANAEDLRSLWKFVIVGAVPWMIVGCYLGNWAWNARSVRYVCAPKTEFVRRSDSVRFDDRGIGPIRNSK
jgi:hypothetical protein